MAHEVDVTGHQTASVATYLQDAASALDRKQLRMAESSLRHVLRQDPDNAEGNRLMGLVWMMQGQGQAAIDSLERALSSNSDDPIIHMTLGSVLMETGHTRRGLACLTRSCNLAPHDPTAWFNLGTAQRHARQHANAKDAFTRALELTPGNTEMRRALATVLTDLGQIEEAANLLRQILRQQPENVRAWSDLANLKTVLMSRQDVAQLQALRHNPKIPDLARVPLTFALAKALDDQREYIAAFDALEQANAMARGHITWDRQAEKDRVEAIAQAFSGPTSEPVDPRRGEGIILIVHVPRSGSTLLEHMLASHPAIQGGGETRVLPGILAKESERRGVPFWQWASSATAGDWARLGGEYLAHMDPVRNGLPCVTDKTPWNWAFVGAALSMLPAARVIDMRRDALETCFSCYRQLFSSGCLFTYDLDDLVEYYAGYEHLGALWRRQFPRRYINCQYEALQRNPELEIRRILDFCGLPFAPECLNFHGTQRPVDTMSAAQVRQKMQPDTARFPQYGEKLETLRKKLHRAGIGSGPSS